MAWTTPVDWTVGQMLSAADLNKVNANLNALKTPPSDVKKGNAVANITLPSSTTYADVSSTLNINFTTNGGPIMIGFTGVFNPVTGAVCYLDVEVDGTALGNGSLLYFNTYGTGLFVPVSFMTLTAPLTANVNHTFVLRAKSVGQSTTLINGATCVPTFWAREV